MHAIDYNPIVKEIKLSKSFKYHFTHLNLLPAENGSYHSLSHPKKPDSHKPALKRDT